MKTSKTNNYLNKINSINTSTIKNNNSIVILNNDSFISTDGNNNKDIINISVNNKGYQKRRKNPTISKEATNNNKQTVTLKDSSSHPHISSEEKNSNNDCQFQNLEKMLKKFNNNQNICENLSSYNLYENQSNSIILNKQNMSLNEKNLTTNCLYQEKYNREINNNQMFNSVGQNNIISSLRRGNQNINSHAKKKSALMKIFNTENDNLITVNSNNTLNNLNLISNDNINFNLNANESIAMTNSIKMKITSNKNLNNFNQINMSNISNMNTNFILSNSSLNQTSEILKAASETCNIVHSIDKKVKDLKFKFLKDTHIDIKKLSKYQNTLITLYSFFLSSEIYQLYKSCSLCYKAFRKYILDNTKKYIVQPFNSVYQDQMVLENSSLLFKKNKDNFQVFIFLKCKVVLPSKYENKTVEVQNSYKLLNHKSRSILNDKNCMEKLRNVYKYDYKYKSKSKQIWWILKENTFFSYDNTEHNAYAMPIIPIKYNDYIKINIPILSVNGLIQFESFTWSKLKFLEIKNSNFIYYNNLSFFEPKKLKDKQLIDYDLSRFCEMELLKNKFNNISKFDHTHPNCYKIKNSINEFINLLMGFFDVQNIEYEDIGFFIFKIYCKAVLVGDINDYQLGIEIGIHEIEEACINEVKKNGLIYDYEKGIQIRIGDLIVFYLTLNKEELNQGELDINNK